MITVNQSDIQGPFVTPPECAGQMVQVAYACTEDHILKRIRNPQTGAEVVKLFTHPASDVTFQPHNHVPKTGRFVGHAQIL
jgi:hypothetical protein